jgi:DNA polymerase III delta subunit
VRVLGAWKMPFDKLAVEKLAAYCGYDQMRIINELRKIKLLDAKLTDEIIEKYVEPELNENIFLAMELAVKGKQSELEEMLNKLSESETSETMIGILGGQIYNFAVAKNLNQQAPGAVAKALGIHPFAFSKSVELARDISNEQLKFLSKKLAEIDEKAKQGIGTWPLIKALLLNLKNVID